MKMQFFTWIFTTYAHPYNELCVYLWNLCILSIWRILCILRTLYFVGIFAKSYIFTKIRIFMENTHFYKMLIFPMFACSRTLTFRKMPLAPQTRSYLGPAAQKPFVQKKEWPGNSPGNSIIMKMQFSPEFSLHTHILIMNSLRGARLRCRRRDAAWANTYTHIPPAGRIRIRRLGEGVQKDTLK